MTTYMNFQGPTFTMQVPTNWLVTSSPNIQAAFIAPANEYQEEVQPNFLVSIRRLEEGATVEGVAESTKENQQRDYPDYEILSEQDISTEKVSGFRRVYKWHKKDEPVGVYQQQTFYLANHILYTLTGTRPNVENISEVDEIFNKMANSFELA